MNGYDLSKNWFDFAFENPEKISPNHAAIYFFAIEHCNRLGWKKKFGFPTQMAMDAIGINKPHTYIRYFNDLVDWNFFELIQRSKNQYSSNIISLQSAMPKNGRPLGRAMTKHAAEHAAKQGTYKQTINHKPKNREKTKVFTPPTLQEFMIYAKGRMSEIDYKRHRQALMNKHESWEQSNWINGRTNKPIKSWTATLLNSIKHL